MGMLMKNKSKVKQQGGLFFKDGELILSRRFPYNRRVLLEVYVAVREYARYFQRHKRDQERMSASLLVGPAPISREDCYGRSFRTSYQLAPTSTIPAA
jgi:hypothetical protein